MDIATIINNIRTAILGKDVRSNIADGIESINNAQTDIATKQENLSSQFNNLVINAGNSNAEIVTGRTSEVTGKTFDTMGHRIDDLDSQTAEKANQADLGDKSQFITADKSSAVNAVNEVKAQANNNQEGLSLANNNISALQSQVSGLSSGAPIGVNLISQMTDHSRMYVYYGSENGYTVKHLYYWNGTAWVDGGAYDSAAIGDKSVTEVKTDDNLQIDLNNFAKYPFDSSSTISNASTDIQKQLMRAVIDCKLTGNIDLTKKYWLRVLCRNNTTYKYRIDIVDSANTIVCGNDGTFTVTENVSGVTVVNVPQYGSSGITATLYIDYRRLPNGYIASVSDTDVNKFPFHPRTYQDININDIALKNDIFNFAWFKKNKGTITLSDDFLKVLRAIQRLKIYGSDSSMQHSLRYVVNNYTSPAGYRFVISRLNNGTWEDFIDTTQTTSLVTKIANGVTKIVFGNTTKGFEMDVTLDDIKDNALFLFHNLGDIPDFLINSAAVYVPPGSYNSFDQSLNKADSVTFGGVNVSGTIPTGTLVSPPSGLQVGDVWADTTDSATHPILRMKVV